MRVKCLLLLILMPFLLIGCSQKNEVAGKEIDSKNGSVENTEYISQKPPQLRVAVNGEEQIAALNGYSWGYFDEEKNSMVGIEAEFIGVSQLMGSRKGPVATSDTSIELKFEEEPLSYWVHIREPAGNVTGFSKEVVLDGQSGRTIYEVAATWEQGTGHYYFSLTVE